MTKRNKVEIEVIETIIKYADSEGIDRDEAIKKVLETLLIVSEISTFKTYKIQGEQND